MPLRETAARAWGGAVRVKTQPVTDRLIPEGVRERDLFGHRISLNLGRSTTHRLLYAEGERFVTEAALVRPLVKPGLPVVDVGANIGYYLLLVKQAGAGKIVCVEPDPDNLAELRRTVALNGLDVEVVEAVAGAKDREVRFSPGLNAHVSDDGLPIRQVAVDTIAPSGTGLLKIDVEGYERQVIEGAARTLERKPGLFVELHPHLAPAGDLGWIIERIEGLYGSVRLLQPVVPGSPLRRVVGRFGPASFAPVGRWGPNDPPFWLIAG